MRLTVPGDIFVSFSRNDQGFGAVRESVHFQWKPPVVVCRCMSIFIVNIENSIYSLKRDHCTVVTTNSTSETPITEFHGNSTPTD